MLLVSANLQLMKNKNYKYASPSLTVDVVIFTIEDDALKVLLIKRARGPFKNSWALPGGFLRENETSLMAAKRVLKDKAGVSDVYMEQLYTFDEPRRDPRGQVVSITYFTLVQGDRIKIASSRGLQEPRFYSVRKLPKLAFDHEKIVRYARERLASKLKYTNVAFSLLPDYFSFSELQRTYEVILERKLDKRNFRKKFMMLGLIKPTEKILSGKKQRPAKLYQFVSKKPAELKKFF